MVTRATGIVLAGGRSSRMGQPKAELSLGGCPLIDVVISRVREVLSGVIVVVEPGEQRSFAGATVVQDDVAHQGPMNGLRHGLAAAPPGPCFVTSCDLPFLNRALIAHLLDASRACDVVVPRWDGRLQPLHAVYRRDEVLPVVEELLAAGERRPARIFERVPTRTIDEDEIRRIDPAGWSFFNVNTPADYREALGRWRRGTRCTVELFGAARFLARTREVVLALPPAAMLCDVFDALAGKVPSLARRVISPDGRGLSEGYACSLNGRQFVGRALTPVAQNDHILILSADVGG